MLFSFYCKKKKWWLGYNCFMWCVKHFKVHVFFIRLYNEMQLIRILTTNIGEEKNGVVKH